MLLGKALCLSMLKRVPLSLLMMGFMAGCLWAAEPTATVEQGGIARWPGEGCDSCGMDGRTYFPVEEVCYYPVDFAKKPGVYQIARWRNGQMETGWLRVVAKEFGKEDIDFPKTEYVTLSPEDAVRHHGEQAQIKPLFRKRARPPKFTLPMIQPTEPLPGGDNFAVYRTFNGEPKSRHTGADYPIGTGTPLKAMADGQVVLEGGHFFAGNSIYLDHGNNLIVMYFHLDEIKSAKGDAVSQGDTVATVGSSGRSTGPHLHVGARWNRQRIDPNLLWADPTSFPTVSE